MNGRRSTSLKRVLLRLLCGLFGTVLFAVPSGGAPLGETSPFHPYIVEGIEEVFGGRFSRALDICDRMIELDPQSPVGHFYRGATYWWMFLIDPENEDVGREVEKNLERAIDLGKKRLDVDADDAEAVFYLGGAYGFRARYRILKTEWWGATWDGKRAKEMLDRMAVLEPDWIDTNLGLGMYNYYVDVLPAYFQVLRFVAFIPAGDRKEGLRQLRLAMDEGLYTRPEAEFFLLDIMKDHEKDYRTALELARDLRQRYPENPFFPLMEALIYVNHLGRWRDAIELLDNLLDGLDKSPFLFADNVRVRAQYYLGKTYFFRGDYERARVVFETLLAGNPPGPEWVIAWTHLRIGQIHDLAGRRAAAEAEYRKVLDMKTDGTLRDAAKRWLREPFEGWGK
jgi:tetratricopeptide (TPR) repeat protein